MGREGSNLLPHVFVQQREHKFSLIYNERGDKQNKKDEEKTKL
jgi:hypothetical protein